MIVSDKQAVFNIKTGRKKAPYTKVTRRKISCWGRVRISS